MEDKMSMLANAGRRMVFWGSLLLIGLAVTEFVLKFKVMIGLIKTIFEITIDAQYPIHKMFSTMMKNSGPDFLTLLFLVLCIIFGVCSLLIFRGPIGGLIAVPIAIVLAVFSVGSPLLMRTNIIEKLKLLPLLLIACGNSLRFVASLKRNKTKAPSAKTQPPSQPYDPFRINRGQ
jgi:ATP/ADP translocase